LNHPFQLIVSNRDDSIVHFDANEQAISVDWSVEDSKKVFDEKRVKVRVIFDNYDQFDV
jgi:hypothetical protein